MTISQLRIYSNQKAALQINQYMRVCWMTILINSMMSQLSRFLFDSATDSIKKPLILSMDVLGSRPEYL